MNELKPLLPGMPEPFRHQGSQMSYDGDDRVFFDAFTREQVRALQLATWKAATEYAAGLCEREGWRWDEQRQLAKVAHNCAAAIRQAPEPTADRGKEASHG